MANEPERDEPLDDDDGADDAETEPLPPVKAKKPAAKTSAVVDDDDDDDEDDDDYEPPPPPSRKPKKATKKSRAVPARAARVSTDLPPESLIDAPRKETLYMLGSLAAAICIMWGASRFACNAHPMGSRKPREVAVAELARDPKGAALEVAQRWAGYDFAGALEVAKGPLAEQLKKDQAACEADKSGCESKREDAADDVLASVVLVSREGEKARARVTSLGGHTGKETYVLELEREGTTWKAVSKGPDTGLPAPKPAPPAPPVAPPTPAPSASR